MERQNKTKFGFDSLTLHILAMILMVCDHAWATIIPGNEWLSSIGRLTFPIYAFLLAEGFRQTKNVKRYTIRLLLLALLSEIPFDLMYAGTIFYPFHQNVIWTFLIALLCMQTVSLTKKKTNNILTGIVFVVMSVLGWLMGQLLMTDYYGDGVLMVMLFFLFSGEEWWNKLMQLAGMIWLNCFRMASYTIPITLLGKVVEFPEQGLAVFALIFIWLYNGKHGKHSPAVRVITYSFYPVHMLILFLLQTVFYN